MNTAAVPITVTSVLQSIWDDVGEPLLVAEMGTLLALVPGVGTFLSGAWIWILKMPVIGPWIQSWLKKSVDTLIANGVIEVKIGIIDRMSAEAQAKWAPQVTLLKQYRDQQKTMSPEEQAAFDGALQNLVQQHGGVVNA